MKASKLVALLWVALLIGSLVVVPREVKAEDTNWWVKSYSGGEFKAVAIAPNGDIIVTGSFTMRLDSDGNVKWAKNIGGSAVSIASNGDIIVADSYTEDFWVLRLDENGNVKWQKTYGGSYTDWARAVTVAPNGDIIVAGTTSSFGVYGWDVWVLRLDENGNVKWQKTYGGDDASAVAIAPNGNIVVAGYSEGYVWVLRLDSNGDVKWQKTYGGSEHDERANAVAIAPNGDIIIAGRTLSFGVYGWDVWVLRLDENGNVKWQKTYGGSGSEWANAVAIAPNGNIIVGGDNLLALDPDGNLKWAKYIPSDDVKILEDGTTVFAAGRYVGHININYVPQYSGWNWDKDVSLEVHDTSTQVSDTNAQAKDTNARIKDTNAEVHDTNVQPETVWTYTPPKGTLSITSTPSGADVYINDSHKGQTPLELSLKPGTYEVTLKLNGYEDFTTKVKVKAGSRRELNIQLKPIQLNIFVPNQVDTLFNTGAFPVIIENPSDSKVNIPITVKTRDPFKVKLSENDDPFTIPPSDLEDTTNIEIPPHQKKVVMVVFSNSNSFLKLFGQVTVIVNGRTFTVTPITNDGSAYSRDIILQKGYKEYNGVRVKVAPVKDIVTMTGYNPKVHGWGFSNGESSEKYNPFSKGGLSNIIHAQVGWFPLPSLISDFASHIELFEISMLLSTYKATNGLCYGMVYTSGLYYEKYIDINPQPGTIDDPSQTIRYKGKSMSAEDLVAAYFSTQYLETFPDLLMNDNYYGKTHEKSQQEAFKLFKECLSPTQVCDVSVNSPKGMHEILAYGLVKMEDNKYGVLVYDPNYPGDTRIIYLNPLSNDIAKYHLSEQDEASIVRIRPILPVDPTEALEKVLKISKDRILLYFDPVEGYTIKTADGKVVDTSKYLTIKGKDYEVVILPKDKYTIEVTGGNYVITGALFSDNSTVIYNITATGDKSTDNLFIGEETFKYKSRASKEISIKVTYAENNLSKIGSVNAKLHLNKNQGILISNPKQVISDKLKVNIDTNGDGIPDKTEIFGTTVTETTSTTTTSTTATSPKNPATTTSKKEGGICGPGLIVGLSMIALLLKRRL